MVRVRVEVDGGGSSSGSEPVGAVLVLCLARFGHVCLWFERVYDDEGSMAGIGRREVEAVALRDGVGEGIGRRDRHDAAIVAAYELSEVGDTLGIARCCPGSCHGLVRGSPIEDRKKVG